MIARASITIDGVISFASAENIFSRTTDKGIIACFTDQQIITVPARVKISGRRFRERPLRTTVSDALFPTLFRLGVSPSVLARWYGHVR